MSMTTHQHPNPDPGLQTGQPTPESALDRLEEENLQWLQWASGSRAFCPPGGRGVTVLLGMEWAPLLGGQIPRQALQRARRGQASHYAWSGESAASVGCARLRPSEAKGRQLHSAALAVASRCSQGTVAVCLDCGAQGIWLVAVHDGAVISGTDCWYADRTAGSQALQRLRERYPALQEIASDDVLTAWFPPGRVGDWPLAEATQLSRVPHRQGWSTAAILAVAAVLAWRFWPVPVAVDAEAGRVDARQAWLEVYEDYARQRRLHDSAALRALLDGLAGLPLRRQGWVLEQAECRSNMPGWRCRAQYRRAVGVADNTGLAHRWPAGWQVEYDGFDRAYLSWQISAGLLLDWRRLPPQANLLRGPVALVQRHAPVFDSLVLGEPRAVALAAPAGQDGMPLAQPDDLPPLAERALAFSGALRGMPLLLDVHWPVSWERLALEVRPPAAMHAAGPETRLVAHLQGVLYGRN